MEPLAQAPAPVQPPAQANSVADQVELRRQPAGPQLSIRPEVQEPESKTRWGAIIGHSLLLIGKFVTYVVISPLLLFYVIGYATDCDFTKDTGRDHFKAGMGDLFKPLTKEVRNIAFGAMGTTKAEEIDKAKKRYYDEQRELEADKKS